MIAEPLEKGLAEDIENEVVQITWNRYAAKDSPAHCCCCSCILIDCFINRVIQCAFHVRRARFALMSA